MLNKLREWVDNNRRGAIYIYIIIIYILIMLVIVEFFGDGGMFTGKMEETTKETYNIETSMKE